LRKKYIHGKIYKEIDFLVSLYRNKVEKIEKNDKKNKRLALKIEEIGKKPKKLE
jgi:hypothetical protein